MFCADRDGYAVSPLLDSDSGLDCDQFFYYAQEDFFIEDIDFWDVNLFNKTYVYLLIRLKTEFHSERASQSRNPIWVHREMISCKFSCNL